MTHREVASLFGRFDNASTWPTKNPRVFHFHRDGGAEYTVDLSVDDGKARYLRVLFKEVCDHVERSGRQDSKNVYYKLKAA